MAEKIRSVEPVTDDGVIIDKEAAFKRREKVKSLVTAIDDNYLDLAGELWSIYKNKEYLKYEPTSYKSWEDYIQGDLTIGKRKAQYLVSIYDYIKNQIHDPDIIAKIRPIGWSKLKELINVIDDENFEYWIKMAKENNTQKLSKLAQAYYEKMKLGKKPTKKEMKEIESKVELSQFITLSLSPEQYQNMHDAIALAKDMSGSDSISHNASLMALDFITHHCEKIGKKGEDKERVRLNAIMTLEKAFGIRIIALGEDGLPFYHAEYLELEEDKK